MPRSIPVAIGDVIQDIFIPDSANYNTKINSIKNQFAYVDGLKENFAEVSGYLLQGSSKVPVITINLGNAESKYNYGSTSKVLDMTWYSRYKPTVDLIIIALVYIAFIWNVFKKLPSIISGASATTDLIKTKGGK